MATTILQTNLTFDSSKLFPRNRCYCSLDHTFELVYDKEKKDDDSKDSENAMKTTTAHYFSVKPCEINALDRERKPTDVHVHIMHADYLSITALQEIQRLREHVHQLEKKLDAVYYAPGMPGYDETQTHFDQIQPSNKRRRRSF